MKALLDTSCLVSFFLMDKHYEEAKNVLGKIVNDDIEGIISALSVAELCGVIRRNTDEQTAKEVKSRMDELIGKGLIGVVPLKAADAGEAGNLAILTSLKGADAVIVSAAKSNGCKLLTFDEEIIKKAKNHVEFFEIIS
ncbi:MAG: PIN domain-containing protein [Candidatus Aenigmarchaeota archaeon]|nr:PIN domain-containing protein [Candidatus Aenigmarchaeota archaeon]